jgi:hypothetical protein
MSLTVYLVEERLTDIFRYNITHNLGGMAVEAGIYNQLWQPETIEIKKASQLIKPLEDGLKRLRENPAKFMKFDTPNGWGAYKDLVSFVEKYLEACRSNPSAKIETHR